MRYEIAAGEESFIALRLPDLQTSTIHGSIVGPHADTVRLVLEPGTTSGSIVPIPVMSVIVYKSRQFSFEGVPLGSYRLAAYSFPRSSARQFDGGFVRTRGRDAIENADATFGEMSVAVQAGKNTPISIAMKPGATISGSVVMDISPTAAQNHSPRFVTVERLDGLDLGLMPLTEVDTLGAFTTVGLPPGDYLLKPNDATTGVEVVLKQSGRQIDTGVITVSDAPVKGVVITVSNKSLARVRGLVHLSSGELCTGCSVYIFPEARALWTTSREGRLLEAATDEDGAFALEQVPAGRYLVTAVRGFDPTWRRLTALIELAAGARSIDLGVSRQTDLDLQVRR